MLQQRKPEQLEHCTLIKPTPYTAMSTDNDIAYAQFSAKNAAWRGIAPEWARLAAVGIPGAIEHLATTAGRSCILKDAKCQFVEGKLKSPNAPSPWNLDCRITWPQGYGEAPACEAQQLSDELLMKTLPHISLAEIYSLLTSFRAPKNDANLKKIYDFIMNEAILERFVQLAKMHIYEYFNFEKTKNTAEVEFLLYLLRGVVHEMWSTDKLEEELTKPWIINNDENESKIISDARIEVGDKHFNPWSVSMKAFHESIEKKLNLNAISNLEVYLKNQVKERDEIERELQRYASEVGSKSENVNDLHEHMQKSQSDLEQKEHDIDLLKDLLKSWESHKKANNGFVPSVRRTSVARFLIKERFKWTKTLKMLLKKLQLVETKTAVQHGTIVLLKSEGHSEADNVTQIAAQKEKSAADEAAQLRLKIQENGLECIRSKKKGSCELKFNANIFEHTAPRGPVSIADECELVVGPSIGVACTAMPPNASEDMRKATRLAYGLGDPDDPPAYLAQIGARAVAQAAQKEKAHHDLVGANFAGALLCQGTSDSCSSPALPGSNSIKVLDSIFDGCSLEPLMRMPSLDFDKSVLESKNKLSSKKYQAENIRLHKLEDEIETILQQPKIELLSWADDEAYAQQLVEEYLHSHPSSRKTLTQVSDVEDFEAEIGQKHHQNVSQKSRDLLETVRKNSEERRKLLNNIMEPFRNSEALLSKARRTILEDKLLFVKQSLDNVKRELQNLSTKKSHNPFFRCRRNIMALHLQKYLTSKDDDSALKVLKQRRSKELIRSVTANRSDSAAPHNQELSLSSSDALRCLYDTQTDACTLKRVKVAANHEKSDERCSLVLQNRGPWCLRNVADVTHGLGRALDLKLETRN